MRVGVVIGMVGVLLAGGAAVREPAVGNPRTATPERAVALMVERSRAEDAEGVMALLASPLRELTEFYYYQEAGFLEPMMARATQHPMPMIRGSGLGMGTWYDMRRIRAAEILRQEVVTPDRVRMTVRETVGSFECEGNDVMTVPYLAVRSNGEWRLFRLPVLMLGNPEWVSEVEERRPGDPGEGCWRVTLTCQRELDELIRDWRDLHEYVEGRPVQEAADIQRRAYLRIREVTRALRAGEYDLPEEADEAIVSIRMDEEKRARPRREPNEYSRNR